MDDRDRKILADIEKFGCTVMSVFDPKEALPPFSYSVGIQKSSGVPEVVVVGLKNELAGYIVNEYNRRVRAGERFEPGQPYAGFLEGFDVLFEPVDKSHYQEYFGYDLWLYGGPEFDVLQVIWPSTQGVWPWQDEASEWLRHNQPLLGKVPSSGATRSPSSGSSPVSPETVANGREEVECDEHGKAYATYLCRHLVDGENTEWYSAAPDVENRWPDAWCGLCHRHYEAEGEWNDASEQAAGADAVELVCHHCYERIRDKCATHTI